MDRCETVLITGGAGFIGSHVARELLARGWRVRALDNLTPQVHPERERPAYLPDEVELEVGDIRDRGAVKRALTDVDAVVHLAAAVGVGQSMYEMRNYTDVNDVGTATLLEAIVDTPVRRLVVASSMSIYGEGRYRDEGGAAVDDADRAVEQLNAGRWEPSHEDGGRLVPIPTPESKAPTLRSVYALGKYAQERMCAMVGEAYGIPTIALRLFNVYGPHQALSNPYTGVLAIFASRILNGRPPLIFEDGEQRRDFVSVHDVARAFRLAVESPVERGVFNIGSGTSCTVREIADRLIAILGREDIEPEVTGRYRVGDIRHCFADIERARRELGYEPEVRLEDGLRELAAWLEDQQAVDEVDRAQRELESRGLSGRAGASAGTEAPAGAEAAASETGRSTGNGTPRAPAVSKGHGAGGNGGDGRSVLITGGAGFIGSNVADRLLRSGESVLIYDNLSRPGSTRNLEWLRERHPDGLQVTIADVRDRRRLRYAVERASHVYHFAAQVAVTTSQSDPLEDFDVNVCGTLNLLESMRAMDPPPPLVFTSTNKVYGALADLDVQEAERRYEPVDPELRRRGLSERAALCFRSPYACSKGSADQYVLDYAHTYGIPAVVFRMSCIYGPRQFGNEDQGWVAHFIARALAGEGVVICGDGRQVRDVLYVDDLVEAFLRAREHIDDLSGRPFNIGGGPENSVSLLDLLGTLGDLLGHRVPRRFTDWRPGDQRWYVSDIGAFSTATGWRPRIAWPEGLERIVGWVREMQGGRPLAAAETLEVR